MRRGRSAPPAGGSGGGAPERTQLKPSRSSKTVKELKQERGRFDREQTSPKTVKVKAGAATGSLLTDLLNGLINAGRVDAAREYFTRAESQEPGLPLLNGFHYTAMIDGYLGAKRFNDAWALVQSMLAVFEGRMDASLYSAAITACRDIAMGEYCQAAVRSEFVSLAEKLVKDALQTHRVHARTVQRLVQLYARFGRFDEAIALVQRCSAAGMLITDSFFSALLSACADHRDWHRGQRFWELISMPKLGVRCYLFKLITWNTYLKLYMCLACPKEAVSELWPKLAEAGLSLDADAVARLLRGGMQRAGFDFNHITFTTVSPGPAGPRPRPLSPGLGPKGAHPDSSSPSARPAPGSSAPPRPPAPAPRPASGSSAPPRPPAPAPRPRPPAPAPRPALRLQRPAPALRLQRPAPALRLQRPAPALRLQRPAPPSGSSAPPRPPDSAPRPASGSSAPPRPPAPAPRPCPGSSAPPRPPAPAPRPRPPAPAPRPRPPAPAPRPRPPAPAPRPALRLQRPPRPPLQRPPRLRSSAPRLRLTPPPSSSSARPASGSSAPPCLRLQHPPPPSGSSAPPRPPPPAPRPALRLQRPALAALQRPPPPPPTPLCTRSRPFPSLRSAPATPHAP
eukprot:tig00000215_g18668.t1